MSLDGQTTASVSVSAAKVAGVALAIAQCVPASRFSLLAVGVGSDPSFASGFQSD